MIGKQVLVILAEGFEEVEALAPVDVLRRCGASVTVAGLSDVAVQGAHGVNIFCDTTLDLASASDYDAVILPGGMPGALNLSRSALVHKVIENTFKEGRLVCAICASPAYVLGPMGILDGKNVTCYPGCEAVSPSVRFSSFRAVQDSNIITAIGPGAALEFGLLIARALYGEEVSGKVHDGMICV